MPCPSFVHSPFSSFFYRRHTGSGCRYGNRPDTIRGQHITVREQSQPDTPQWRSAAEADTGGMDGSPHDDRYPKHCFARPRPFGQDQFGRRLPACHRRNNRLGRVDDGSSLADFDPDEKERHQSLDSHVLHCNHRGNEINIIDAPGMPDFINGAIGALAAVEIAAMVVSATAGVEANTRKHMELAKSAGLARIVVVNKCDADNVDIPAVMAGLQEAIGRECVAVNLPGGTGREFKSVIDVVVGERMPAAMPVGEAYTRLTETVDRGRRSLD